MPYGKAHNDDDNTLFSYSLALILADEDNQMAGTSIEMLSARSLHECQYQSLMIVYTNLYILYCYDYD